MNKKDLAKVVAKALGTTNKEAEKFVDATVTAIAEGLVENGEVRLGKEVGSLVVKDTKARKGHNIQTGEEIEIPASKAPKFKPSKALRKNVKQA